MPKYCYKCTECESEVEVRHSMSERLEDCEVCEKLGVLIRIPQLTNIVKKQEQGSREAGSLVKEYINENKEILRQEKKTRIEFNE